MLFFLCIKYTMRKTGHNIVSYAILSVTAFAEKRQKIAPVVQRIHQPLGTITENSTLQHAHN